IKAHASELGLDEQVLWLGARNDPEKLMAACDITTLTSDSGEGFPNSVAESMACGIACVVTDVGDAAEIASEFGLVVTRASPVELARAWETAIDQNDVQAAVDVRQSIIDRYSPTSVVEATLEVLRR
ncbi:MAG: glycosyltransferase, partial [Chloroflexi bacterium]|nr:glycosyltransferase [Chloroflexota bacterium]